jgi:hypothetical protein
MAHYNRRRTFRQVQEEEELSAIIRRHFIAPTSLVYRRIGKQTIPVEIHMKFWESCIEADKWFYGESYPIRISPTKNVLSRINSHRIFTPYFKNMVKHIYLMRSSVFVEMRKLQAEKEREKLMETAHLPLELNKIVESYV